MLQGDKTAVDELLTNPTIKSISFVGSTPIAQYVYATGTAAGKRVQALGGAKNHMVVLPDADLDLAADADGQRRASARPASAAWRSAPASPSARSPTTWSPRSPSAPTTLKIGDGTKDSDMGPLVTKAHRDKVASYIDAGEADGATIVVDGRTVTPTAGRTGSGSARP